MAVRPMHPIHMSEPPNISAADILKMALEILEMAQIILDDAKVDPFRWLGDMYVQWRPLAVALAELCVQTEGPLVDRAWAIVGPAYETAATNVADTNKGMLWRPIEKLMRKARQKTRADVSAIEEARRNQTATPKKTLGKPGHIDQDLAPKSGSYEFRTWSPTTRLAPNIFQGDFMNPQFGLMPWSLDPQIKGLNASAESQDPDAAWATWGDFVSDLYPDGNMDVDLEHPNPLHGP